MSGGTRAAAVSSQPTDGQQSGPVAASDVPPKTVVLTIQHPGHVHFFKHAHAELSAAGHDVHVFLREKSVARDLLEAYDIEYTSLAGESGSLGSLATTQATYEWRLLRAARRLDPDVMAAIGGVAVSHVATVVGARSVVFTDTEHATLVNRLAFPFADVVCTPGCYRDYVGTKQVRYPGYHELAYLHPDRFSPDPSVLDAVGIEPDDSFVVLRLISWDASHDVGHGGFDNVGDVVARLEATGARVLITAEGDLPDHLEDRRVSIDPHRMHDLLYYADLFVGEGATTAAESAVLGTPAVYVNSLSMGYTDELATTYGLLFTHQGETRHQDALDEAISLLEADVAFDQRRRAMLDEKRDVTDVIIHYLLS